MLAFSEDGKASVKRNGNKFERDYKIKYFISIENVSWKNIPFYFYRTTSSTDFRDNLFETEAEKKHHPKHR